MERRESPRAHFPGRVTARFGSEHVDCEGVDLSESGMRLFVGAAGAPRDQPILLDFLLPAVPEPLILRATLKRCESLEGHTAWAVAFIGVPRATRRMLRTYVHVGHGRVIEYDEATA